MGAFDDIIKPPAAAPVAPGPVAPGPVKPNSFGDITTGAPAAVAAIPTPPPAQSRWPHPTWKAAGKDVVDDIKGILAIPSLVQAGGERIGNDIWNPSNIVPDVKKLGSAIGSGVGNLASTVGQGAQFAWQHPGDVSGKASDWLTDQITNHPVNTALNAATLGRLQGVSTLPELAGVMRALPEFTPIRSTLGGISNYFTKAGEGTAQEAYRTGRAAIDNPQIGQDFREGMRDPGVSGRKTLDYARQGLENMQNDMFSKYKDMEQFWKGDQTRINFNHIDQVKQDFMDSQRVGPASANEFKFSDADRAKIANLEAIIKRYRDNPDLQNPASIDGLKQKLRNTVNFDTDASPQVRRFGAMMSDAAKDSILDQAPVAAPYRQALNDYFEAANHRDDIVEALSLGNQTKAATSIKKLQSVMRNNAYNMYGGTKDALEALEKSGGVSLKPGLAGQAMSATVPRGIAGHLAPYGAAGLAGGAGAMLTHSPLEALILAAAGAAGTSPRLAGEVFHGIGRANSVLGPITRESLVGIPGLAERIAAQNNQQPNQQRRARGGRIGAIRAALGRS